MTQDQPALRENSVMLGESSLKPWGLFVWQDGDPVLHVDLASSVLVSAHADHAIRIWDLGLH